MNQMHRKHRKQPGDAHLEAKPAGIVPSSKAAATPAWTTVLVGHERTLQPKLNVNQPGDPYEQEADAMAEQVMRMPAPGVQRCACGGAAGLDGECEECKARRLSLQRKGDSVGGSEAPPSVHQTLNRPGQPLDDSARDFMETRFGTDFSGVRVHTDSQAAQSAQDVSARAYTVGSDVVFGAGQYAPGTEAGNSLLAHELTHVVQQDQSSVLHRDEQETPSRTDGRVEDPNFLLCMALCYLGIPPGLWRAAVNMFLEAVSAEYRHQRGEVRGSEEFQAWRAAFLGWSAINILKAVLNFAVDGKVGVFVVTRSPAARAAQERLFVWLIARGATAAGLGVAAQAVRKVTIALELIWVAGCATYCGGMAAANAIIDFTAAASAAIASFSEIARGFATGITEGLIFRPILTARATVDPANWDTSVLIWLIGQHLWRRIQPDNPDQFLANMGRPLRTFGIPTDSLPQLAREMSAAVRSRTGWEVVFTGEMLAGLTPITFVQLLQDYRLLRFNREPSVIADEAVAASHQQ